jgi:hypothetical protein
VLAGQAPALMALLGTFLNSGITSGEAGRNRMRPDILILLQEDRYLDCPKEKYFLTLLDPRLTGFMTPRFFGLNHKLGEIENAFLLRH